MTVWSVVAALRRHLLIVACGLVLTLSCALFLVHRPGVYWSQVDVQFLLPISSENPNSYQFSSDSLISLAGVIGKSVGVSPAHESPASDEVTLVGQGITSGYSVRLPNQGGQWATNFSEPLLDVQAAGATPDEVQETMQQVIQEIENSLAQRQDAAGVRPNRRVSTKVSPSDIPIYYGGGSDLRVVAATVIVGLGLTTALVVGLDRRKARTTEGEDSHDRVA